MFLSDIKAFRQADPREQVECEKRGARALLRIERQAAEPAKGAGTFVPRSRTLNIWPKNYIARGAPGASRPAQAIAVLAGLSSAA